MAIAPARRRADRCNVARFNVARCEADRGWRAPRAAVLILIAALTSLAGGPSAAAEPVPTKIAVFEFELDDRSAGGGIIAADAIDTDNLTASTREARRLLLASGRYTIVDAGGAADTVKSAGGIRQCGACDVALARELGADQSMVGVITRVNRTEYTLQIVVRDTRTGAVVSDNFTGLRMGANYAWSRGVRSLMDNHVLATRGGG